MIVKRPNNSYNDVHMVTPELLDFIRSGHDSGMTEDALSQLLLTEGGWNKEDVNEAFQKVFHPVETQKITPATISIPAITPASTPPTGYQLPPQSIVVDNVIAPTPPSLALPDVPAPKIALNVQREAGLAVGGYSPILEDSHSVLIPRVETQTIVAHPLAVAESFVPAPIETVIPINSSSSPDDFLGIFSNTQEFHTESLIEQENLTPFLSAPRPIAQATPTPTSVDSPTTLFSRPIARTTTEELVPPMQNESIVGRSIQVTKNATLTAPQLSVAKPASLAAEGIIIETPFSGDTQEKVSPVKFNFEKLRSTLPQTTLGESQLEPVPREILSTEPLLGTPSIDEILTSIDTPLSQTPKTIFPPHTEALTAKAKLMGKRTMESDMLLRGITINTPPAIEEIKSIATPPPTEAPVKVRLEDKKESVIVLPPPPPKVTLAEDIMKKNKTKRIIAVAIGGFLFLTILTGAGIALFRLFGPDPAQIVAIAQKSFFDVRSFGYEANIFTGITISNAEGATEISNSKINVTLVSAGNLTQDQMGYGDGGHRVILKGGIESGGTAWPTDMEIDMRIIGSALYFHLLNLPSTSNLDPALFKTYWIKVDLSEIAKELALSGVVASQEGYGNFGGQGADATFNALLGKYAPFDSFEMLDDEKVDGVSRHHIIFKLAPEKSLEFVSVLYRKYFGKELALTDDQRVRFKDALGKLKGDIWINKESGELARISLEALLDDDLGNFHVSGTAKIDLALNNFNATSVISPPTPILTLEELRAQMENYKGKKELSLRDKEKVDQMKGLIFALSTYREEKGRFPAALRELYTANILASSTLPESKLNSFTYAAYGKELPLNQSNRCTEMGKLCEYFHIGISLEDMESTYLAEDYDVASAVRGSDMRGCLGEGNFACYDIASSGTIPTAASTLPAENSSTTTRKTSNP